MSKYGTVGLWLFAPVILGPVLTSIGAVALGARPRDLALYSVAGSFAWSLSIAFLLSRFVDF